MGDDEPSKRMTRAVADEATIIDGRNRAIRLKKPDMLAQYDLVEVLGNDRASNSTFLSMVAPLIYVAEVAGEPVFPATTYAEVRALIKLLGEEGIQAVAEGIVKYFSPPNPDAEIASLKK